jgi:hypothetical protein
VLTILIIRYLLYVLLQLFLYGSSGSPYLPNPLCSILENVTLNVLLLFLKNYKCYKKVISGNILNQT